MSTLSEALRYMQAEDIPEIHRKAEKALALLREASPPRYLYRLFPINKTDTGIVLQGADITLTGETAEKMLCDCHSAAVMICTLGFGFEALLRTWQARSMADAVILDGCGSALAEEGCDEAQRMIAAAVPGGCLTDRFSPGYGDMPLALQRDILRVLNAEKLMGVHLTDSMLFNPCKTVSAIIGISDRAQPARIRGCDYCSLREGCSIRKAGGSCGK